MLDLAGLALLLAALGGAVKGWNLPLWLPQILAFVSLGLIVYQGAWKHSRFALIHAATLWAALTWIAGHALEAAWGKGILTDVPIWAMLFGTPLAAMAYRRAEKRLNPASGKKLELKRTDTSLLRDLRLPQMKKKKTAKTEPEIPTLEFDLGEDIEFQNK